jgi:hypothetical protein
MLNTTLISLLRSLSSHELKELGDLIKSPFFNKKTSVTSFFKYLKKFHPNFNDNIKLKKENVFNKLYPGKEFNYGVMKNLIYELNKLTEKYLELVNYEKHKPDQFIFLIGELVNRNIYPGAEKSFKSAFKVTGESTIPEAYKALKRFQLEKLMYNFTFNKSKNKIFLKDELSDISLKEYEHLNKFFLIESHEIYNYLLSYTDVRNRKFELQFEDKIVEYFKEAMDSNSPEMLIRANILMLKLNRSDESIYFNAKDLLSKYEEILKSEKDLAYNFFASLTSVCRQKQLSGEVEKYLREMFFLFRKMLEFETLSNETYFPLTIFRNIINISTRLKEFEWAENFFNEYKNKLSTDCLELAENTYFSSLNFEKGNFETSLEYVSKLDFADDFNKLQIKNLLLRNSYELKRFSELIDIINSYKQYLMHNKNLTQQNLDANRNLIRFTEELIKLNFKKNKPDLNYLIEKIKNTQVVSSREWLILKVNEMKLTIKN